MSINKLGTAKIAEDYIKKEEEITPFIKTETKADSKKRKKKYTKKQRDRIDRIKEGLRKTGKKKTVDSKVGLISLDEEVIE
jgi:hypothetical protein